MSLLNGKKVIIIGDRDGVPGPAIEACAAGFLLVLKGGKELLLHLCAGLCILPCGVLRVAVEHPKLHPSLRQLLLLGAVCRRLLHRSPSLF